MAFNLFGALARQSVWGISRNRSVGPFLANPEARNWNARGWPGASAPANLSAAHRSVDPRVKVLVARSAATGRTLASFAVFGCHSTALGQKFSRYSADWPGVAAAAARHELAHSGSAPIVAIAGGPSGDVSPLGDHCKHGAALMRSVGNAIGRAIAQATATAAQNTIAPAIRVGFRQADVHDREVDGFPIITELADQWAFGVPTVGGAPDALSALYNPHGIPPIGPGVRSNELRAPQRPKAPVTGLALHQAASLFGLAPSRYWPLHVVALGDHLFATVPGEPTTMTAFRMENRLLETTRARTATILGYAGDYAGYFTTPEEYELQHYEGSSMLYGRFAAEHVRERLVEIAATWPRLKSKMTATFP